MTQPSALTLGTVQLGMAYGRVVQTVQPVETDAFALLDAAWGSGITSLDTAAAYGDAEGLLGRWIGKRGLEPFVMTKLAKSIGANPGEVHSAVSSQASKLGVATIDALLVHDPGQLTSSMAQILLGLEEAGLIGGFGASVYTMAEAAAVLGIKGVSFIQVPFSVADRRFEAGDFLARAGEQGVRIFVRSLFLQGVLLQDPATLPAALEGLRAPISALGQMAGTAGVSAMALCLAAARHPAFASRIIGVADINQLQANLRAESETVSADLVMDAVGQFHDVPPDLIDPRTWKF